jgi:hypothetical protein
VGFFSSHFSFRWRQVKLKGIGVSGCLGWGKGMFAYHPVRERMTVGSLEELWGIEAEDAYDERPNTIYA